MTFATGKGRGGPTTKNFDLLQDHLEILMRPVPMLVVLPQVLSRYVELGTVVRHDRVVGEEAEEVRRVLVLPRLAVGLGEAVQLVVVGCVGAFDGAGGRWDSEIHGV